MTPGATVALGTRTGQEGAVLVLARTLRVEGTPSVRVNKPTILGADSRDDKLAVHADVPTHTEEALFKVAAVRTTNSKYLAQIYSSPLK